MLIFWGFHNPVFTNLHFDRIRCLEALEKKMDATQSAYDELAAARMVADQTTPRTAEHLAPIPRHIGETLVTNRETPFLL